MTSIDRLVRPHFAEGRCTAMQEGFLYGLIPGVITDINDPEGIGRVKVECPLIHQHSDLPNDRDAWIPVAEDFVVNARTGGKHTLLQPGTQVVLACLFGDPRQMIVLKCLPSRVDRPHPEFHRAKGTYGAVTPGDVIEANNDTDASQVIARPNGMVQQISGEGTLTYQSQDHARLQLTQDGNSRLENDKAFTLVTSDGTVKQQSAEGALAILDKDGTVKIKSNSIAQLKLEDKQARLDGPLNDLSQVMQDVQSQLSGFLGMAQEGLNQVTQLVRNFVPGSTDIEGFVKQIGSVLKTLNDDFLPHFNDGLEALSKLKDFSVESLGRSLLPQLDTVRTVSQKVSKLSELLSSGNPDTLIDQLSTLFPEAKISKKLTTILHGLRHDPELQLQSVLDEVLPDGFASIKNIVGLDLHKVIDGIESTIADTRLAISALTEQISTTTGIEPTDIFQIPGIETLLNNAIQQVRGLIPSRLQNLLSDKSLTDILTAKSTGSSLQTLAGNLVSGLASQAETTLSQATEHLPGIENLHALIQLLQTGKNDSIMAALDSFPDLDLKKLNASNLFQSVSNEVLPGLLNRLHEQLTPIFQQGTEYLNQLLNAVPDDLPGATLRVTNSIAQLETSLKEHGAIVRAGPEIAELISPEGLSKVFAKEGTAGISTPFGEFGFGSGGGGMFSLGQMALKVAQKLGGEAAGLLLSSDNGVSLSSFDADSDEQSESKSADRYSWQNENARVKVKRNTVTVESLGASRHRILVSPDGIWLDNYNVEDLMTLLEGLARQASSLQTNLVEVQTRVTELESQSGSGGGTGLVWHESTDDQLALPDSGYFANGVSLVTFILPASALVGSRVAIVAQTSAGWRLAQNSGQSVEVGDKATTEGITGRLGSTAVGDSVELIYVGNDRWRCISFTGNLEII
jgi:hypothetical protein